MKNAFVTATLSLLALSVVSMPALGIPSTEIRDVSPLLERQTDSKLACAACVVQCGVVITICIAACGPGEIFGPVACANCLVVAGASQQCVQCVEKCESANGGDGGPVVTDCGSYTNTCTDQYGSVGLCSISEYTSSAATAGIPCPAGQSCDVSVANTDDCGPLAGPSRLA